MVRKRGLMILVSDLLAPIDALERNLISLTASGHEVVLFHVLDPAELAFDFDNAAMFHVVEHAIRMTGSDKLVLTGGTALNCLCNMKLLDLFDNAWYRKNCGRNTRLQLWVPPVPGDAGAHAGRDASRHGDGGRRRLLPGLPRLADDHRPRAPRPLIPDIFFHPVRILRRFANSI